MLPDDDIAFRERESYFVIGGLEGVAGEVGEYSHNPIRDNLA